MGWDVIKFAFDGGQGASKVFNYELAISEGSEAQEAELIQGDGVVLNTGQVYFNRRDKLEEAASRAGVNPDGVIHTFATWVVGQRVQT